MYLLLRQFHTKLEMSFIILNHTIINPDCMYKNQLPSLALLLWSSRSGRDVEKENLEGKRWNNSETLLMVKSGQGFGCGEC